jgi:hypothetical protein
MSKPSTLPSADPLARTLAQRQVDPNEAAKSFTHLRALYERAGDDAAAKRDAVARWWRWLETVAGPGARAVIRSGRTQDYYRAIQDACRLHLANLEPGAQVQTLGWAVRLMRYYRNAPGALDRPSPFGGDAPEIAPPHRAEPPRPPEPIPPKTPQLPSVGGAYTAPVVKVDESAVLVEVPDFAAEKAIGVIKAEDLGGRKFREGNTARVEVIGVRTLKSGRTIVELRPAPRTGNREPRTENPSP